MSRFISIEGGDGAGKTTQATLLIERLHAAGVDAELVREPGGTPLGEEIRRWVKGGDGPGRMAELFLFEAARAELVKSVIKPALERGAVVVTDRFTDSSLAYQGYGRGIDLETVRSMNRIATSLLSPTASILLDIEPEAALARLDLSAGSAGAPTHSAGAGANAPEGHIRRAGLGDGQRFESEPLEFHRRVAEGYRKLAAAEPKRWFVVDATSPPEVVAERIWSIMDVILQTPSARSKDATPSPLPPGEG